MFISIALVGLSLGIETNPFVFLDAPSLELSASCEQQIPFVSLVFRPGVTLMSELNYSFFTGGFTGYEAWGPSARIGVCREILTESDIRLYAEFYSAILAFRYISSDGGSYGGPWRWVQSVGGQAGFGARLSDQHELVFFGRIRTPLIWDSDGGPFFPSSLWSVSLGYYFHFPSPHHEEESP